MLVTFCLGATTLLRAQEVKTEIAKPVEIKAPPAENKPSPLPEFKSQPGSAAKPNQAAPVTDAETPSPFKKDENAKPEQDAKPKAPLAAPVADVQTAASLPAPKKQ